MDNSFRTNPHKAAAKIQINNSLLGVCLTMFGFMWAFAPERLSVQVLVQFIFAVPLLYISNNAYSKIAYWRETKIWDYFGWLTSTIAIAFVLNIIGILTFLIGHPQLTVMYFLTTWILLGIYTCVNLYYKRASKRVLLFKYVFFVLVQLLFGIGILYV